MSKQKIAAAVCQQITCLGGFFLTSSQKKPRLWSFPFWKNSWQAPRDILLILPKALADRKQMQQA